MQSIQVGSLLRLLKRYQIIGYGKKVMQILNYHDMGGMHICPGLIRGIDYLRDARLNKGLGFSMEERQALGLHGLLPPCFKSQDEQAKHSLMNFLSYKAPINKYIYLTELQDRNEQLFFKLLSENVEEMMPIVYTPTVGIACQKFGLIFRRSRGLFITIYDRGHVFQVLRNWPKMDVRAIVVTDGERILGLGDLGAYGMGIPVGKLALYTALAGIKPDHCLPIVLDVGTNTQTLLDDPNYIGLRQKRIQGKEYYDFIDEFMTAVVAHFGQDTLIQFEDFANQNAFPLLDKYQHQYLTFNDDIQGTASVVVAGLMASLRITKGKLSDHTIVFQGAGAAALGIATLIVTQMVMEGTSKEVAYSKIWLVDIDGLVAVGRPEGQIDHRKEPYAKKEKPMKNLEEIIRLVKPSVILGASAVANAFTENILKFMGEINDRPIIFALSNPTSKAECTAIDAYTNTDGRAIFASGSPFDPVELNGKKFHPGQGNNAYIFPGVALAALCCGMHHIQDEIFLIAASTLADIVSEKDLALGRLYPPVSDIRECSLKIATIIVEHAYKTGKATKYPEPKDKCEYIKSQMYDHDYKRVLPEFFKWKEDSLPK